jgi:hypothetical protein
MNAITPIDREYLRLLRAAQFSRRPNGWYFGVRKLHQAVLDRLVESGRLVRDGDGFRLAQPEGSLGSDLRTDFQI